MRFNAIPMDQPGRYFYLHDRDRKDFWSASWQPMGKLLDKYKSIVEYANNWYLFQDFFNLQYTQHILWMDVVDNIIDHGINVLLPDGTGDMVHHDGDRHTFLGVVGAEVTGYDTDRDIFLGNYRSYHNPEVVEKGQCTNLLEVDDNGCGVLQIDVESIQLSHHLCLVPRRQLDLRRRTR